MFAKCLFPELKPSLRVHVWGMSYLDGVPKYTYDLPCGHAFFSRTVSEPDDDDLHWFYCRSCNQYSAVPSDDLVGGRPMYASGRRLGHHQLSVLNDAAILRDRVAAYYRTVWNSQSLDEVSRTLGIGRIQVARVAVDLGVYEDSPRDLGDRYR